MSQEVYTRKATFSVTLSPKGSRIFTPVNKKAKFVAKKLGKRGNNIRITVAELKATKGAGTYKFYAYTSEGTLAPIRF